MESELSILPDPSFTTSYLSYTSHPSQVWAVLQEHFKEHTRMEGREEGRKGRREEKKIY